MLASKISSHKAVTGLVLAAVLAVGGVTDLVINHHPTHSLIPKQNLFTLVNGMQSTTGSMLANTKGLETKVNQVNDKLGQLTTQERILSHQMQTGQALQTQLTRQQQLTQNGVDLMQQILQRQKVTAQLTKSVSTQTLALSNNVFQSVTPLTRLAQSISTTNQESVRLNGQMTTLLAALNDSMQEFKVFGQVDRLLKSLLGNGGGSSNPLPSGSGLGGVLSGVGSGGSSGGSGAGSGSGSGVGSVGNTLGNTLNSTLGNTTGGLLGGN